MLTEETLLVENLKKVSAMTLPYNKGFLVNQRLGGRITMNINKLYNGKWWANV